MFYQVVLRADYMGQECLNTFDYYTGDIVTGHLGAFSLLTALGFIESGEPLAYPSGKLFSSLFSIVSNIVHFNDVMCQALYDPLDFMEQPFNPFVGGGDSGGNGLSPVMAYGFNTSRVRLDVSRGHKRFVGVTENRVNDGGYIDASQIALLNTLAVKMGEAVTDSSSGAPITFKPVILGKEKYTTPRGKTAYRKYPTEVQQLAHTAQNIIWSPYNVVRTQNSRQYGRGV